MIQDGIPKTNRNMWLNTRGRIDLNSMSFVTYINKKFEYKPDQYLRLNSSGVYIKS